MDGILGKIIENSILGGILAFVLARLMTRTEKVIDRNTEAWAKVCELLRKMNKKEVSH